jgi:hypothetical protein
MEPTGFFVFVNAGREVLTFCIAAGMVTTGCLNRKKADSRRQDSSQEQKRGCNRIPVTSQRRDSPAVEVVCPFAAVLKHPAKHVFG